MQLGKSFKFIDLFCGIGGFHQAMSDLAPNGVGITVGQIILRADDALFSSLGPYADNAKEWWTWLLSKSNNASSIKSLIDYVNNSNPSTSQEIKDKTGVFFQQGFNCTGKDGAFDEICDNSGNYKKEFIGFATFVNKLLCGNTKIPRKCIPHKGTFKKINVKGHQKDLLNRLMSDENLFSYAFIYGPNAQYSNYSYTLNLK